jgi:trehalose 6-phosphate synthase/phosphatase
LTAARPAAPLSVTLHPEAGLATLLADVHETTALRLLLDYDGTLVPLARNPELAMPDAELLALLEELAAASRTTVDIVSGRPRHTLEAWLGELPVALWAEHGFWHRPALDQPWQAAAMVAPDWLHRIRPILEQFTAATPGSLIEAKSASVAWHYRRANREFGARQAHELRMLLGDALSNQPFEVLEGKKVIEVRMRGVSKSVVAQCVGAQSEDGTVIVAIGDDRTDEELFRELPPSTVTVAVGSRPTCARFRLSDYHAVRQVLRTLLTSRPRGVGEAPPRPTSPTPPSRRSA